MNLRASRTRERSIDTRLLTPSNIVLLGLSTYNLPTRVCVPCKTSANIWTHRALSASSASVRADGPWNCPSKYLTRYSAWNLLAATTTEPTADF